MIPSSQRRCFVTSAVFHGLVLTAAVLVSTFAPASSPPPLSDRHYITLVPITGKLSAEATSGGSPTAVPHPPAPLAPPPALKVPQTPPKAVPKILIPPPATLETTSKPPKVEPGPRMKPSEPRGPNLSLKPQDVDRERSAPHTGKSIDLAKKPVVSTAADLKARHRAEESARLTEERAEAKRQALRDATEAQARADWEAAQAARREALSDSVAGLGKAIAGTMKIELPGPGGGGAVALSYADYVQKVFQVAWNRNRPATLAAKSAQSRVLLLIRRDGSFTYKILTSSRVADVDAAIGRILKQQGQLRAFPSDLSGEDLEIIITFTLESTASG